MVSIIIPVYNTAHWLAQCVDSCLNQSYTDIEVILVNDASTDSSADICRKYADSDKRVKLIDKTVNEGVDLARHSGFALAKGEYIMTVDSDDWLCNRDIISLMVSKADEVNADYVEMAMQRVMDRHGWIKRPCQCQVSGLIEQPELFEKYYISFFGVNILPVNLYGKLYRKSVLDRAAIKPSRLIHGEDLTFNLLLFPHLNRIYLLDEVGYSYRYGGMTSKYNPKLMASSKIIYPLKKELIEKYGYTKADDPIRIEMKNVFWTDVCQQIRFHTGNRKQICQAIATELSDPDYQDLLEVNSIPGFKDDPLVKAILAGDAEAIYDLAAAEVKRQRPMLAVKRLAARIFSVI